VTQDPVSIVEWPDWEALKVCRGDADTPDIEIEFVLEDAPDAPEAAPATSGDASPEQGVQGAGGEPAAGPAAAGGECAAADIATPNGAVKEPADELCSLGRVNTSSAQPPLDLTLSTQPAQLVSPQRTAAPQGEGGVQATTLSPQQIEAIFGASAPISAEAQLARQAHFANGLHSAAAAQPAAPSAAGHDAAAAAPHGPAHKLARLARSGEAAALGCADVDMTRADGVEAAGQAAPGPAAGEAAGQAAVLDVSQEAAPARPTRSRRATRNATTAASGFGTQSPLFQMVLHIEHSPAGSFSAVVCFWMSCVFNMCRCRASGHAPVHVSLPDAYASELAFSSCFVLQKMRPLVQHLKPS
jgi:hypothetical protein